LDGGSGLNGLFGGSGSDGLVGGSSGDFLDGGDGNDVLASGDGADYLLGGTGSDWMFGGFDAWGDVFAFRDYDGFYNNVWADGWDDIVWDYDDAYDFFDLTGVAGTFSMADILVTDEFDPVSESFGVQIAYGDDGFGDFTGSFFVVGLSSLDVGPEDFVGFPV
jgi:Ca2+-binding RTX toxin-like protein